MFTGSNDRLGGHRHADRADEIFRNILLSSCKATGGSGGGAAMLDIIYRVGGEVPSLSLSSEEWEVGAPLLMGLPRNATLPIWIFCAKDIRFDGQDGYRNWTPAKYLAWAGPDLKLVVERMGLPNNGDPDTQYLWRKNRWELEEHSKNTI